jgi:hypothetical protein
MGHIFRELGILTFLNISAITALPARTLGTRLRCRTDTTGFPEREGTFNMCTRWLVEALTRAGRADPARLQEACLFEKLLGWRII